MTDSIERDAIERRTHEVGREIFANIDTTGPSVFNRQWWDDWVMDWSMADEAVKVQMFRFIDVLPMLKRPEEVAEHLQAYFSESEGHFPLLVRLSVGLADPGTVPGRVLARTIRRNASRLARRFIAGSNPAEVLRSVQRLRDQGMTFTMDLLGEATVTEREADEYLQQYLDLLETLGPEAKRWTEVPILDRDPQGPIPRINLSVKVTALNSQFDPIDPEGSTRVVAGRLRKIFRVARRHEAFINLDMEQYVYKDLTLSIFCQVLDEPEFRDWPHVGIAIQAYLLETEGDLRLLLDWARRRGTPVWVRLVKGAYWDYETVNARKAHWPIPVWTQKWQSDACFERCSTFLLENHRWLRPAIASHNIRSMAHAIAVAEHLGLEVGTGELQMLYGMGDELKQSFLRRGLRLRIYTPFGKPLPGMAYLVRRLLENTSNTSFLRATFTEHSSIEALLRSPTSVGADHPEPPMPTDQTARETLPPFSNEPVIDFSHQVNRDRMQDSLQRVKDQFGARYDLSIGGERVVADETMDSVDPANFEVVVGHAAKASPAQAEQAVRAAAAAFEPWRRTSVWRRADALFEVARRMREQRFDLAAWEVYECGKQWREADADIAEAIDFCEFYARSMLRLAAPRRRDVPGEDNEYTYRPRGVTVVIAPWNFPIAILCGMTVGPLVAGNPVILKPAEQSSVVAAKFFELFADLDLPPGTINFLPGIGEEIGPVLVNHPDVAVITFTGSVPVGLEINRSAATPWEGQGHVKRVVSEMGGKNSLIIDDDADLDEAVTGVVRSAFAFQGQKCSACSRVIVLPKVFEQFVNRLTDAVASLTVGPPSDPAFFVGPVIDAEAFERLGNVIEQAKAEATCLHASDVGKLSETGYYIGPHLFVDAAPDSFLGQTEFFGPVLAIFRAADLDDSLRIANATRYALTGGIYTRNPRSIERVKRELEVGNLYINRTITGAEVDRQPFGGYRLSGIGAKAGGPDYLLQFLTPRTVTENTLRRGFAPEVD